MIVFITGFLTFTYFGFKKPFREKEPGLALRFRSNLYLFLLNSAFFSLLGSITLIALAHRLEQAGVGLFNTFKLNQVAEILLVLVTLDFAIYLQHVLTHKVFFLWRLHRVHHTDTSFDTSTALRFHTLEILFSLFFKALFITVLGASAFSIIILEISVNFFSMFNHSNFSLPKHIEVLLRKILITPDIHRIHHSVLHKEMNSNFGFSFSIWDRILGTYKTESVNPPKIMKLGQEEFRSDQSQNLKELIIQPFKD